MQELHVDTIRTRLVSRYLCCSQSALDSIKNHMQSAASRSECYTQPTKECTGIIAHFEIFIVMDLSVVQPLPTYSAKKTTCRP
jgi:hypothetical protein